MNFQITILRSISFYFWKFRACFFRILSLLSGPTSFKFLWSGPIQESVLIRQYYRRIYFYTHPKIKKKWIYYKTYSQEKNSYENLNFPQLAARPNRPRSCIHPSEPYVFLNSYITLAQIYIFWFLYVSIATYIVFFIHTYKHTTFIYIYSSFTASYYITSRHRFPLTFKNLIWATLPRLYAPISLWNIQNRLTGDRDLVQVPEERLDSGIMTVVWFPPQPLRTMRHNGREMFRNQRGSESISWLNFEID